MKSQSQIFRKIMFSLAYRLALSMCLMALVLLFARPSAAFKKQVGGGEFRLMGYFEQGVALGLEEDYDSKHKLQSAYYNFLVETEYSPTPNFQVQVDWMLSGDWAYELNHDNDEWQEKGFGKSRNHLYHDTVFRDLLQECHVTWTTESTLLRIGKQIVVWGEMDLFRIMDQINPLDQRRGLTDLEFESTILPIWLLRFEYFRSVDSSWLYDVGFEFIFNPNADFEPNRNYGVGNDVLGIWAADLQFPLGGPKPFDYAHVGSFRGRINEPDTWDSDAFEYGFKLTMSIKRAKITLNYLYGIDNDPAVAIVGMSPPEISPYDGRTILHLNQAGYYPRQKLLGGTLAMDFPSIYSIALGGVCPILRLEAFYNFNQTYGNDLSTFEKHDEFRWGVGVDWKIKVDWLNPRAYIMIWPQFYHRHISDYPSNYGLSVAGFPVLDDSYQHSLLITTSYYHNKIVPTLIWLRDRSNRADIYKAEISYVHSSWWTFNLGAFFFNGQKEGAGFELFDNKDHVYFTIGYRF